MTGIDRTGARQTITARPDEQANEPRPDSPASGRRLPPLDEPFTSLRRRTATGYVPVQQSQIERESLNARRVKLPSQEPAPEQVPVRSPSGLEPPGSSSRVDFYFSSPGDISPADRVPYRALELAHADLFATTEIAEVKSARRLQLGRVKDADLEMPEFIKVEANGYQSLGTKGVSTCVAICARGEAANGDSILGLHHYSGTKETAAAVLENMHRRMSERGASNPDYYLVGGLILSAESGMGSHEIERSLLDLRKDFNIVGAKLHILEGEYDKNGEDNMLNVVVTPGNVYFSKRSLYEYED